MNLHGLFRKRSRRALVVAGIFACCLAIGNSARSATVLVSTATSDAFVGSDDQANQNFGASIYSPRGVGQQNDYSGNQIGRQLYQFDFSDSTIADDIIEATLQLHVYDNYSGSPQETSVLGITDQWSELSVTWNTQPHTNSQELDSVLAACCGNTYEYDVTDYVVAQFAVDDRIMSFQQRSQNESEVGSPTLVAARRRRGDGKHIDWTTSKIDTNCGSGAERRPAIHVGGCW